LNHAVLDERKVEAAATVGAILRHAVRIRFLDFVGERKSASPAMFAVDRGLPVSTVGYRARRLEEAGCIAITETRPVRGAVEHFFRLTPLGQSVLGLVADL
jgi:hypothetical protein